MKKEKPKNPWRSVRKAVPPPTRWHKDKSKYTRKYKHKKGDINGSNGDGS